MTRPVISARLAAIQPPEVRARLAKNSTARRRSVAPLPGGAVTLHGLRLVSEANAHAHYRERSARAKAQRHAVHVALVDYAPPLVPAVVRIVRVAPNALDTDNLTGSAKHVRDAVAEWLGIDDRDERVTWHVGQEKGDPREYAVRVLISTPKPGQDSAVVRTVGAETHVELTLTPESIGGLARTLEAFARDDTYAQVPFDVDGVKLTFKRSEMP